MARPQPEEDAVGLTAIWITDTTTEVGLQAVTADARPRTSTCRNRFGIF
jgi:hypothetical protein